MNIKGILFDGLAFTVIYVLLAIIYKLTVFLYKKLTTFKLDDETYRNLSNENCNVCVDCEHFKPVGILKQRFICTSSNSYCKQVNFITGKIAYKHRSCKEMRTRCAINGIYYASYCPYHSTDFSKEQHCRLLDESLKKKGYLNNEVD